jgi:hypothetical protein
MKLWKKIILCLFGIILFGGICIYMFLQVPADLRTDYAKKEGETTVAQQKGKTLLEESLKELDPISQWQKIRTKNIQVTFQHFWYHEMLKKFVAPVEKSGQKVSFLLKPDDDRNLQLTFLDGQRKGTSWGIKDYKSYKTDKSGNIKWKSDWTTEFNLPSYRFFLFLPFFLSEAELITYAGTKELHGNIYELVYATWEKWTPHNNADQYLIYINRKTKVVDYVQGTVRAVVGRSITALSLTDYREVLGMKIPFSLEAIADINNLDEVMHQMKLTKVEQMEGNNSEYLFPKVGNKTEN